MSYLAPHFDPDVFVSYSHGDWVGGRAMLKDWTQALIRRLHAQLRSLETEFKDLHLWMDPEIDPTAKLTEELRKTVSASGVLMIVMSKHYLATSTTSHCSPTIPPSCRIGDRGSSATSPVGG